MALVKQFERRLDRMWKKYSAPLRALVKRKAGAPPKFTKKWRNRQIEKLLSDAEEILCKQGARDELTYITEPPRWRMMTGYGTEAKFDRIRQWARRNLHGSFIYSFWRKKRCLYVGKAKSWRRLLAYRKSQYLLQATRVRVDSVAWPSELGKAECLAIHLFRPRDNVHKSPHKKWGKACPVCVVHDKIRSTLRGFFKLK